MELTCSQSRILRVPVAQVPRSIVMLEWEAEQQKIVAIMR
jgi:hypothetical protein